MSYSTKKSTLVKRILSALAAGVLGFTSMALSPITASAALSNDNAAFMKAMGAGWNLGNSLDANDISGLGSETCWSNPKTTKAMIQKVHDAGFQSIRIPVSWANHMDGDYQIDYEWMSRVKEVVDYAYNDGMYVILNTHHDNLYNWQHGIGYYPDDAHRDESLKFLGEVWTQISYRFAGYGDRLIFETMNEPRLRGTGAEWWFDTNNPSRECVRAVQLINEYNQKCVDTIRAAGSGNKTRYIMVPGYVASHFNALDSRFVLPTDPVTTNRNRIAVSIHAYRPYELCLTDLANDKTAFDSAGKKELDEMFVNINSKFLSKGVPVIIGETGISDKNNPAARKEWLKYYYTLGKRYSVPCFLWDNNTVGGSDRGENHGHLDRTTLTWRDPQNIEAIMSVMKSGGTGTVIYGDVTNDGEVDTEDIARMQQYISHWGVTVDIRAADVNADGEIDTEDIARLQQYVSKWAVKLGVP